MGEPSLSAEYPMYLRGRLRSWPPHDACKKTGPAKSYNAHGYVYVASLTARANRCQGLHLHGLTLLPCNRWL